jgi:hypothetical protein
MTTTTTTPLGSLKPGDVFTFRGSEYLFVQYGRGTKEHIAKDGKRYTLARTARVELVRHDDDALAAALSADAEKAPTLPPGTKVRIVSNQRTRNQGIAGVETVIVRRNPKTYGLANGWRVSPALIEEV